MSDDLDEPGRAVPPEPPGETPGASAAPDDRPRVAFLTLGCPKNEVDTDKMRIAISGACLVVEAPDTADVIVVNTCSFIEEATSASIEAVLELAEWKAASPGRRIVVAGCMPSRYGPDLAGEMPEVDAFVPVASEDRLLEFIAGLTGCATEAPAAARGPARPSEYLMVADGCHRACAYCTIPRIRGPYRSRPLEKLVSKAQQLVGLGARELVLIGQDVTAWGHDLPGEPALADLVRALSAIEGLAWLRLMYAQPDAITPDLLEAMAASDVVCRYLDMPLQHASHEVLRRMGRRGSGAEYLRMIGAIRGMLPGVALRTTVIAGFPGETEDDVEQLEAFIEDAGFDYTGVFAFSPEEGTRAADMPDQVPEDERLDRARRLRDVADRVGMSRAETRVGTALEVLVEGSDEDGAPFGRHRGQAPDVDGVVLLDRPAPSGAIVTVRITAAAGYDLEGEIA